MVDDSKNLKDKIFASRGLAMIGSADILGAIITGIFWLSIASFLEVERYGELHYFLGIAGIAYVLTLIGTQNTITVYSAKKVNVVSTLFFVSISASVAVAVIVFIIYNKLDVSLLIIAYTVYDL